MIGPVRQVAPRELRSALEARIDQLIALLDAIDGDADLEWEEDAEHDGVEPDADHVVGDYDEDQRFLLSGFQRRLAVWDSAQSQI